MKAEWSSYRSSLQFILHPSSFILTNKLFVKQRQRMNVAVPAELELRGLIEVVGGNRSDEGVEVEMGQWRVDPIPVQDQSAVLQRDVRRAVAGTLVLSNVGLQFARRLRVANSLGIPFGLARLLFCVDRFLDAEHELV